MVWSMSRSRTFAETAKTRSSLSSGTGGNSCGSGPSRRNFPFPQVREIPECIDRMWTTSAGSSFTTSRNRRAGMAETPGSSTVA